MKEIYIVYETDEHLSVANREMKGCFEDEEVAIQTILANAYFKNYELSSVYEQLETMRQTQGRDINYIIEPMSVNEWY